MAARLCALALYAAFLSCQRERPSFYVDNPSADRSQDELAIVADHPSAYLGKTVTVSGHVGNVLGEKAFILEARGPYEAQLLVVGADPFSEAPNKAVAFPRGQARFVEATGEVRRFDRAAFERATGTLLDAAAVREWTGRPALLAKSLKALPPQ